MERRVQATVRRQRAIQDGLDKADRKRKGSVARSRAMQAGPPQIPSSASTQAT